MVMSYRWLSAVSRGNTCSQCDSIPPMTPGMPRNPTTQTRVLAMLDSGPSSFGCTGTRPACTLIVPLPTPHLATMHCSPGLRTKAVTTWKQHKVGHPNDDKLVRSGANTIGLYGNSTFPHINTAAQSTKSVRKSKRIENILDNSMHLSHQLSFTDVVPRNVHIKSIEFFPGDMQSNELDTHFVGRSCVSHSQSYAE